MNKLNIKGSIGLYYNCSLKEQLVADYKSATINDNYFDKIISSYSLINECVKNNINILNNLEYSIEIDKDNYIIYNEINSNNSVKEYDNCIMNFNTYSNNSFNDFYNSFIKFIINLLQNNIYIEKSLLSFYDDNNMCDITVQDNLIIFTFYDRENDYNTHTDYYHIKENKLYKAILK